MKIWFSFGIIISVVFIKQDFIAPSSLPGEDYKTLAIGAPAPGFNLPGVDGKTYSLSSFSNAKILVVIFTCNHCPTAQSYEDRIIKLNTDYADKNVAVAAIMPNDPKSLRLDELDFSDLGDSFEDMKIRAADKQFNFPYLYDGETEITSKAYGPVATPHVFVFDKNRKLRYTGRFDDMENHDKTPRSNDTRNAIEALLHDKEVAVQTTKVFGCSVKWSEKRELVQKSLDAWAKEPVSLDTINETGIKELFQNKSGKLLLVNIWSTASESSVKEFQEFITMNRMYRDRDFEFISISADNLVNKSISLAFLKNQQASNKNYFFTGSDIQELIKSIGAYWQGNLPYTILVEPGGKIVYSKQGIIDAAEMKKVIVNNHLIGRYP